MKKIKLYILIAFLIILSGLLLNNVNGYTSLVPLVRDGSYVYHYSSSEKVMIPDSYDEHDTEFRGAWVATVYNLDIAKYTSETQYKAAFISLIDELKANHMNAMLFQVRPLNDAFYESDYAPWSRYLMGNEGSNPGWDVLAWMIDECHANGIEFHAWLNPYRVANTTSSKTDYLATLASNNFARMHPDLVVEGNVDSHERTPLILNPGEPEVKEYIRNVIKELINNYNVDGIHFDDYFYPYSGISSDSATYNLYKLSGQTIKDWRRENVNDVVRGVKEDIDAYNDLTGNSVKFGISPFGLWGSGIEGYSRYLEGGSNTAASNLSSYLDQYADSRKWVEEGWLDYICPQVYFTFTHSTAPYADVVDWWASIARGTGVDVYIGHAVSSAALYDWEETEIADQLKYNLQYPEIKGEVMYRIGFLDDSHMQYVTDNQWTKTPTNIYESNIPDIDITVDGELSDNIYISDVSVTLSSANTIYFQLDGSDWSEYIAPLNITGSGNHVIYLKTVDEFGKESSISSYNIVIQYLNLDVPTIEVDGDKVGDNYIVGSKIVLNSSGEDIYVAINHGSVGEFELYTGPITLTDTGSYYIRAKTIDSRGTESDEVNKSLNIQEDCYPDPIINVTGIGQDPNYQSAIVSLSGETNIQYKINDGLWIDYTEPFELTTEGSYTIYYKNNDACQVAFTKDIVIDTTKPENATIIIDGTYDGEKFYTSETTVSFSTSEENTVVIYRMHNGKTWSSWQVYTGPINLVYTANYTFEYKVIDEALNESEVISQRVRLDIPPTETNLYVIRDGEIITYYNSDIPIELPTYTEKSEEIRAVWIATVSNIDIGLCTSEEDYKQMIIRMLDEIEVNNFNTIFFQVRPMNDAFYDSDYAPWSRYLTGTEGVDPGWNVLQFLIDESHKRGIEFHAWLNPYRVSTGTGSKEDQLNQLSSDNFARLHPELVIRDNAGKLLLNPGERQVQVYIRNVIQELIANYNVDGIHFDDYFYSYNGTPLEADEDLYNRLKEPNESLDDWRRENINTVVREIHEMILDYNQIHGTHIRFGISPFGIWKSGGEDGSNTSSHTFQSYSDQFADSRKWVMEGWVDYILPQLYWEFDHKSAPFADLVDWWAKLCDEYNVDLIIGHGFYRYDNDSWTDVNELPEQLRYIFQYDSIIGSSFFSYRTLLSTDTEVVEFLDRLNNYYWTEYVTFPWESDVEKEEEITCPVGQVEENGICVDICPVGEEYIDNECQSICAVGEEYVDGECQSVCAIGEEYVNGECQSVCAIGEEYVDGECQSICGIDQTYQDGSCVYLPCQDGYVRVDGTCVIVTEPKTGCGFFNAISLFAVSSISLGGFLLTRKWFM